MSESLIIMCVVSVSLDNTLLIGVQSALSLTQVEKLEIRYTLGGLVFWHGFVVLSTMWCVR